MKKYLYALILSIGYETPYAVSEDQLANQYSVRSNPTLTAQEKAALAMAQRLETSDAGRTAPLPGPDGSLHFVFGTQRPSIVCAVLQVCDVALQAGEQINSINLGDTARWLVEPAVTGNGPNEVQHLIIKPLDVDLKTSMIVTTDRRTYHIQLRSHRTQYMPKIAFIYPKEARTQWDAMKASQQKARQNRTIPETGESLESLNFNYTISGSAPWKPVRVYNNGVKTIIQMPATIVQTEAPVLLVVRKGGGLFTQNETVLVNYRMQGDRYIVDTLFDQAILVIGVGARQDRVMIQRGKS